MKLKYVCNYVFTNIYVWMLINAPDLIFWPFYYINLYTKDLYINGATETYDLSITYKCNFIYWLKNKISCSDLKLFCDVENIIYILFSTPKKTDIKIINLKKSKYISNKNIKFGVILNSGDNDPESSLSSSDSE